MSNTMLAAMLPMTLSFWLMRSRSCRHECAPRSSSARRTAIRCARPRKEARDEWSRHLWVAAYAATGLLLLLEPLLAAQGRRPAARTPRRRMTRRRQRLALIAGVVCGAAIAAALVLSALRSNIVFPFAVDRRRAAARHRPAGALGARRAEAAAAAADAGDVVRRAGGAAHAWLAGGLGIANCIGFAMAHWIAASIEIEA